MLSPLSRKSSPKPRRVRAGRFFFMSKTRNTKVRSDEIQTIAQALVDQPLHDSLPLEARKPIRVAWQHQLIQQVACDPKTARTHIAKALHRLRLKAKGGD